MNAFELVVVRHGRTAWNASGRFQGHADVPLDAVGCAQAAALARKLANENFERAIASDLERARTTAAIILENRAPPLEIDARWREFDFGAWEGLTWPEIAARFPEAAKRSNAGGRFVSGQGGSEHFDVLVARVGAALSAIAARDSAKVLVVTHAGPLYALLRLAYGSDERAFEARILPAAMSRFIVQGDAVRVQRLNEVTVDERTV